MTHEPSGATPLDPDETQGLIPTHITTLDELNEWEQANIIEAEQGLLGRRIPHEYVLSSTFVRELHARMFAETWKWAGQFRTSDKNIGIPWDKITVAVHVLCSDVQHWLDNDVYGTDEAAARFHHHLTYIHPFPTATAAMHASSPTYCWNRAVGPASLGAEVTFMDRAMRATDTLPFSARPTPTTSSRCSGSCSGTEEDWEQAHSCSLPLDSLRAPLSHSPGQSLPCDIHVT